MGRFNKSKCFGQDWYFGCLTVIFIADLSSPQKNK